MKNFGYCIWLTPDSEEDEWYSYTNGFEPHITILKYLNEEEAKKRKELINDINMEITLVGELIECVEEDFNSLYYNVISNKKVEWWPEDAHVSFNYSYKSISKKEQDEIKEKIKKRTTKFSKIKVKKCDGDYSLWNKIIN